MTSTLLTKSANAFIYWVVRKRRDQRGHPTLKRGVIRFDNTHVFNRYEFYRIDERIRSDGSTANKLPWWLPVNVFLHHWNPVDENTEGMHDHPRWSITICLRGRLIEHTPWWTKTLKPGSIVIRSRKAIHAFSVPKGYSGRTWTLFIVGRRKYRQNTYIVTPR